MSRVIKNQTILLKSLNSQSYSNSVELAGGFILPEKPNRELRRRLQREAKKQIRISEKEGAESIKKERHNATT